MTTPKLDFHFGVKAYQELTKSVVSMVQEEKQKKVDDPEYRQNYGLLR
ncbi:MAG: hypothetical protein KA234_00300 [Saprospiraceae bacterium]|nr:hypothetical protein [Saprospiraceae bacterium]